MKNNYIYIIKCTLKMKTNSQPQHPFQYRFLARKEQICTCSFNILLCLNHMAAQKQVICISSTLSLTL